MPLFWPENQTNSLTCIQSTLATPPPTPLQIAEIFAGLVHNNERSTVISDEETQASLDTLLTQV